MASTVAPRVEHGHRRRFATMWQRFGYIWKEIGKDEVFDRAAALSYYFMFSLFPMLLVVMAILGTLHLDLMEQLVDMLSSFMPSTVVRDTMTELAQNTGRGLLSLGVIFAIWSASSGMLAVMTSVNVVFDLADHRPWWKRQLLALGLTVGLAVVIPLGLLLLLFGDEMGKALAQARHMGWLQTAWSVGRWVVIVVLLDAGINLVYYLSLAQRPKWRFLTPGSTFAVAAWIAMSLILQAVLRGVVTLGATYGSVAGVMAMLLWLYYSGVLVLVGAEIDAEIGRDWSGVTEASPAS